MKRSSANVSEKKVNRDIIVDFLDKTLETATIKDYSNNELQVQGNNEINRIAVAVDACMESYKLAVEKQCQMLIVHHGLIWNGIQSIRGREYNHIKYLIENDLNLYASHLPLDLHPKYGNNAQLAKLLSLQKVKPFGLYNGMLIGYEGVLPVKVDRSQLVNKLCESLNTECTVFPFGKEQISSVAVISGGAGKELAQAIQKGVDCYITGESIHENYHAALEAGINVIYAGHYHTEKTGVQAIGKLIEEQFGVETVFLESVPVIERQTSGVSMNLEG
jgi:dinuclear metal center YbgI/SA1388 family protein